MPSLIARSVFGLALSVNCLAVPAQSNAASDAERAARIGSLTDGLRPHDSDTADAGYEARLNSLAFQLQAQVDEHIQSAFKASEGSKRIQARLRAILADHKPNSEYGDPPFAAVADLRLGTGLIVAYTIVRGVHNDLPTIHGYWWNIDRFELADTAGNDFSEYSMFKAEVKSPTEGEFWLLAWGQAHTFNGKKVRLRIYAFDGQRFRTVWNPEDLLDADVRISSEGFTIDQRLTVPPFELHDKYTLAANGPVKVP